MLFETKNTVLRREGYMLQLALPHSEEECVRDIKNSKSTIFLMIVFWGILFLSLVWSCGNSLNKRSNSDDGASSSSKSQLIASLDGCPVTEMTVVPLYSTRSLRPVPLCVAPRFLSCLSQVRGP